MWAAVEELIERAPGPLAMREHRLHLLADWSARRVGASPSPEYARDRVLATAVELAVPVVLAAARAAWDGPLVLFKGPDVARRYPAPATRPCSDLDLLTSDASSGQRALLAAGFRELGDPRLYTGIHHLRPLWLPGTPLTVELHAWPKWPERLAAPPTGELLGAAVAGDLGVAGVDVLPPEQHALVLAAHAWAHAPLARAGHLVDIAAVLADADAAATARLARRWGCGRLWGTTHAAADALIEGGRSGAVAIWARHLRTARERTVFETHAQRWLAPLWAMPPHRAPGALMATVADDLRPGSREGWPAKIARSWLAVANARRPRSEHEKAIEARG